MLHDKIDGYVTVYVTVMDIEALLRDRLNARFGQQVNDCWEHGLPDGMVNVSIHVYPGQFRPCMHVIITC